MSKDIGEALIDPGQAIDVASLEVGDSVIFDTKNSTYAYQVNGTEVGQNGQLFSGSFAKLISQEDGPEWVDAMEVPGPGHRDEKGILQFHLHSRAQLRVGERAHFTPFDESDDGRVHFLATSVVKRLALLKSSSAKYIA